MHFLSHFLLPSLRNCKVCDRVINLLPPAIGSFVSLHDCQMFPATWRHWNYMSSWRKWSSEDNVATCMFTFPGRWLQEDGTHFSLQIELSALRRHVVFFVSGSCPDRISHAKQKTCSYCGVASAHVTNCLTLMEGDKLARNSLDSHKHTHTHIYIHTHTHTHTNTHTHKHTRTHTHKHIHKNTNTNTYTQIQNTHSNKHTHTHTNTHTQTHTYTHKHTHTHTNTHTRALAAPDTLLRILQTIIVLHNLWHDNLC
jgi:hypothetical protein